MRDILCRLEARGLIQLPPRQKPAASSERRREVPTATIVAQPVSSVVWRKIQVERVKDPNKSRLWDMLITKYHYLGRRPIVGRNLRQLVFVDGQPVACLAWCDPCLKLAPRDKYLAQILASDRVDIKCGVNNTRFLVLPWVEVPNLASKVLALAKRHMRQHWFDYYHNRIEWAETFVDPTRFIGTCYAAANWRFVGLTEGTARSGSRARRVEHGIRKNILVYIFNDAIK
jgi:hypothetical protein